MRRRDPWQNMFPTGVQHVLLVYCHNDGHSLLIAPTMEGLIRLLDVYEKRFRYVPEPKGYWRECFALQEETSEEFQEVLNLVQAREEEIRFDDFRWAVISSFGASTGYYSDEESFEIPGTLAKPCENYESDYDDSNEDEDWKAHKKEKHISCKNCPDVDGWVLSVDLKRLYDEKREEAEKELLDLTRRRSSL